MIDFDSPAAEVWIKAGISELAAREAAKRVADFLRSRGASRIFLFGSLARGYYLPGKSDIDIYFEGVPSSDEYDLTMDAHRAFPDFPFDFQTASHRYSEFCLGVRKRGIEL